MCLCREDDEERSVLASGTSLKDSSSEQLILAICSRASTSDTNVLHYNLALTTLSRHFSSAIELHRVPEEAGNISLGPIASSRVRIAPS